MFNIVESANVNCRLALKVAGVARLGLILKTGSKTDNAVPRGDKKRGQKKRSHRHLHQKTYTTHSVPGGAKKALAYQALLFGTLEWHA